MGNIGTIRGISALMAMAMSSLGGHGDITRTYMKSPEWNYPAIHQSMGGGINFHRTFTGKRIRNGKKKRNMNHLSKLTKMKHDRRRLS